MLIEVLISMFGLMIILRILSLLQKFEVLKQKNARQMFIGLQIPIYFPIFFKELFIFSVIYIGLFLTSLIFFQRILRFFVNKTLEKRSIQFIDELILLMKTGKSAQSSLKMAYAQLSEWEKTVFKPILFCFEPEIVANYSIQENSRFYFEELRSILKSTTKVIDQLVSFREGLKIQRNLRHKSAQVTKQIRAQAVVAIFIYCGIFALSWFNFNLKQEITLIIVSLSLFLVGEGLVFFIGGTIKWKT